MRLYQYRGPFKAQDTISIGARVGYTYVHIGVQIPNKQPIAHLPLVEDTTSWNLLSGTQNWSQGREDADFVAGDDSVYSECSVIVGEGKALPEETQICCWDVSAFEKELKPLTWYTLSFWAKASEDCTITSLFAGEVMDISVGAASVETVITSEWYRYQIHWKTKESFSVQSSYLVPVKLSAPLGDTVYIEDVSFEDNGAGGKTATAKGYTRESAKNLEGVQVYVAGVKFEEGAQGTSWCVSERESWEEKTKQGLVIDNEDYRKEGWESFESVSTVDLDINGTQYRLSGNDILEFDGINFSSWDITILRDLPWGTIIDIAYEDSTT